VPLATLALFVVSLGYGVVVPALPRLASRSADAASASELSIVYASYAVAKILAQVPGGVWVDRRGHGRVLPIALAIYVLSLLGFLAPLGPAWFSLMRAVEGAATGLVYPAVFARVFLTSTAADAGRRIGVAVGVGSSGLLIGPVLGALLEPYGSGVAIVIAAALGAAVLAFSVFAPGTSATVARPPARKLRSELAQLARLAKNGRFVSTMLPIGFNKLTFSAYQGLLPLVGPEILGVGPPGVALLFVVVGVTFAVAQPVGGTLVDRFSSGRVTAVVLPVLLASVAALSFARGLGVFAALFALHVFSQSVVFTATVKQAAREHGSESTYGGVFGLLATLTDTMTIVGPLLFLNVYAATGRWTFAAMGAVGAVFALSWALGTRPRATG
jgi:MFS transporter, DHA1 family, solute carrier family 18 (vesicular amine transporter), member 1/2